MSSLRLVGGIVLTSLGTCGSETFCQNKAGNQTTETNILVCQKFSHRLFHDTEAFFISGCRQLTQVPGKTSRMPRKLLGLGGCFSPVEMKKKFPRRMNTSAGTILPLTLIVYLVSRTVNFVIEMLSTARRSAGFKSKVDTLQFPLTDHQRVRPNIHPYVRMRTGYEERGEILISPNPD